MRPALAPIRLLLIIFSGGVLFLLIATALISLAYVTGGWNDLLERDYSVDNDKLTVIDASIVPNNPNGQRLTLVDETGNYPQPSEVWFVNRHQTGSQSMGKACPQLI